MSLLQQCDAIFSKKIRERDNWRCQRCRTRFAPGAPNLHCSHFHGRSNKATRYDFANCDAICSWCHLEWEADKHGDYKIWKIAQLGQEAYDALERRARSIIKFGAFEQAQKLKELKYENI